MDLRAGTGLSMMKGSFGAMMRVKDAGATFEHAWQPTLLSGQAATFLPGTVNNVAATIGGVPLSEAPRLTWDQLKLTPDNTGFFAVEVTLLDPVAADREAVLTGQPKREAWSVLKVEIVQVADPDSENGEFTGALNTTGAALPLTNNRARWPIAWIERRGNGSIDVFPIVHFPLIHRVALRSDGVTPARHFFYT